MHLSDTRALRRGILKATLDHIDGRGDHWFGEHFLMHFEVAVTPDNVRIVNREIGYLLEKGKIDGVPSNAVPVTYAVRGITALGQDDLDDG